MPPSTRLQSISPYVIRSSQTQLTPEAHSLLTQAGAETAALLFGRGTSTTRSVTGTANKNFVGFWTESTATSGDSRGMYLRHYISGAGSGEALRVYATANAAGVAAGGTINGMHCSLSVAASATISGQGQAARFTLDYAADTATTSGNVCVVNLESNLGTGITAHANASFIRVVNLTAQKVANFARFQAPGAKTSGDIFLARHADCTATHAIQICDDAGTKYWIMVSTDTPAD